MSRPRPKRLITHSETFHTDDVFATALLLDLFPDAEVVRSRDEAVIATGDIVYDVGKVYDPAKGRFDHHQEGALKRDNGIIYCSFGLLWREYGLQFCRDDQALWDAIDKWFVMPIDANDNGQEIAAPLFEDVHPFTVDSIIRNLNSLAWVTETETQDEQFKQAVELAGHVLRRVRDTAKDTLLSQQYLLELYQAAEDKRLVVAEKDADVSGILDKCPELLYVVGPRLSGSWGVAAVPKEQGSFATRRPFPEAWRAQPAEELVKLTGVPDVMFVHAAGFLAVADSRDGAIAIAKEALEK